MTNWQPIETAPRDGAEILALDVRKERLGYAVVAWTYGFGQDPEDGEWSDWSSGGVAGIFDFNPQYWMPLPEPPGE